MNRDEWAEAGLSQAKLAQRQTLIANDLLRLVRRIQGKQGGVATVEQKARIASLRKALDNVKAGKRSDGTALDG